VARHRSPQGRRAHLTPPLSAIAAAGAGGAHRSIPVSQLTSSLPVRFVATAVAGGALAAAGQHALAQSLPATGGGSNVLRLGVQELLGSDPAADPAPVSAAAAPVTRPLVALAPVSTAAEAPETQLVDAAELVKATDIQRQLTEAGTRAAAEQARAAETARAQRVAEQAAAEAAAAAASDGAAADRGAADGADKGEPKSRADTSSLSGGAIQMVTGRVTSGFGSRWGARHQGLDIAAPIGTPIRVPFGGTVIDSGAASGFGLWVRVRHDDGTVTTYGHVNRSFVRTGEQVEAGQKIAEVGNRGRSTGPHLHMEVTTPGGTKVNPRPWLDQHGIRY
jgi:murein DD-endopeptidase MepM/ murein hydrolase activator NlpD